MAFLLLHSPKCAFSKGQFCSALEGPTIKGYMGLPFWGYVRVSVQ